MIWQPSDKDSKNLASLKAYISEDRLVNVRDPLVLDVCDPGPSLLKEGHSFDFMLAINMIHVSEWEATKGLLSLASRMLKTQGLLFTYGPYSEGGRLEPESNRSFNESLLAINREWGIRDLKDIEREAAEQGLQLFNVVEMPANNKTLVFKKVEESRYL